MTVERLQPIRGLQTEPDFVRRLVQRICVGVWAELGHLLRPPPRVAYQQECSDSLVVGQLVKPAKAAFRQPGRRVAQLIFTPSAASSASGSSTKSSSRRLAIFAISTSAVACSAIGELLSRA